MSLIVIDRHTPLPSPELALRDPNGLLAVGTDLSPRRLDEAYAQGIFPWYSAGQPVLWWSPDPRMVLPVAEFAPGRNLRKKLRRIARGELDVDVRINTAFAQVIAACAAPRPQYDGTWINADIQRVYTAWHHSGRVHSIETWMHGQLVGGLYGVSLGRMFFGESMFSRVTDASKIALAYLVAFLARHQVELIDCQQETAHLASLGARIMPRDRFIEHIRAAGELPALPWRAGVLSADGQITPLVTTPNAPPCAPS